jgi:hypothetical protein
MKLQRMLEARGAAYPVLLSVNKISYLIQSIPSSVELHSSVLITNTRLKG